MKRLILVTGTALAVIVAASAAAQETPFTYRSEAYCQNLAELATAMAHDRETGDSLESAQAVVMEYRAEFDDEILIDYLNVAENVYRYPRLMPSEEGNTTYNHCMGYD